MFLSGILPGIQLFSGDESFASLNTPLPQDKELLADEELNRPHMIMPYAGTRGETILKKAIMKIPEKVRPKIIYKGTKLSTFSSVKDKIKMHHLSNIVYYYKSGKEDHIDYIGETKCRFGKRINLSILRISQHCKIPSHANNSSWS